MSVLKIARMGHPILAGRAARVENPASVEVRRLVDDMIETMADANAAGLAAPQVFRPVRLVIFHVPAGRAGPGADAVPLTVLINPEIIALDAEVQSAYEGCLSLPGMVGRVPRLARVRYRGVGLDGEVIDRIAEGFHARVVQHECDHLDGVLYPRRMPDLSHFGFAEEIRARLNGAQTVEED